MQTYLDILLRRNLARVGLAFLMCFLANLANANSPSILMSEKDSLLNLWMENDASIPFVHYVMRDFNDRKEQGEVGDLALSHALGGVVLSNGHLDEVGLWIRNLTAKTTYPMIFTAAVQRIFELPFEEPHGYPTQLSVLCFANDTLVYNLGVSHANLLTSSGLQVVKFNEWPLTFTNKENSKVMAYFNGLKAGGMSLYLGGDLHGFVWENSEATPYDNFDFWSIDHWEEGKQTKKAKQFRKQTGYQGTFAFEHENLPFQIKQKVKVDKAIYLTNDLLTLKVALIETGADKRLSRLQSVRKTSFQQLKMMNTVEESGERCPSDSILRMINTQDYVVLNDPEAEIPWKDISGKMITFSAQNSDFTNMVDKYRTADHRAIQDLIDLGDSLFMQIDPASKLIIDLTEIVETDISPYLAQCDFLAHHFQVAVFLAGNEQVLQHSDSDIKMIWRPVTDKVTHLSMVQMLFGARTIAGQAPGFLSEKMEVISRPNLGRLRYPLEDDVSPVRDTTSLYKIDAIVAHAIQSEMMPGCQIMVVKQGDVVYDKSFGFFTYDSLQAVNWTHLYDLASLTKTIATLPGVMMATEDHHFSLTDYLGKLYSVVVDTDKDSLLISDLLIHQSGLRSYIPFWRHAKWQNGDLLYKQKRPRRENHALAVNWSDSIQSWITSSTFNSLRNADDTYRYLYSDLGFMIMKEVLETTFESPMNKHLAEVFYEPLGMDHTLFNPLNSFSQEQISPTENDVWLRKRLLQGEVHDKNAALLDGVSGHAGLFSNANDLAKYMQGLMAEGSYGGTQYFEPQTIAEFTAKSEKSYRRALGWDKPDHEAGNVSKYASPRAYGHSGFTGTLVWADPEYELIYIFLSNRIYPDANNNKLIESNTRTRIHDFIYESFIDLEQLSNHSQY